MLEDSCVYILGAGASIGHTGGDFPAIDTIFQKALNLNILDKERIRRNGRFSNLVEYIRSVFGKNVLSPNVKLNFEELLTYLDIDIENESTSELANIRQEAFSLLRETLRDSQALISDTNLTREYDLLVNRLRPQDSICTFNWDILLDAHLGRKILLDESGLPKNQEQKYKDNQYYNFLYHLSGTSVITIAHSTVARPYTNYQSSMGYYLKLHGSVDWFYCDNRLCRAHALVFPVEDYFNDNFCSECHKKLRPMLIPPILNKSYNQFAGIQKLWSTALRKIERCTELIIWGYSLPPTDFNSSWLLRQARMARKISIINPDCLLKSKKNPNQGTLRKNRIFLEKFHNMFCTNIKLKAKIEEYEYFSDFCNYLTVERKYDKEYSK